MMHGPVGLSEGRFLGMSTFPPRDLLGYAWWETRLQPWGAEGMRGGGRWEVGVSRGGWQDALGTASPEASVLTPGGSSFLCLSWRAVERRCLPLGFPASFPGPD